MYEGERIKVRSKINSELMPAIKAEIPAIIRILLRAAFPRITDKILVFIEEMVEIILLKREIDADPDTDRKEIR